jgi:hypothetical protein
VLYVENYLEGFHIPFVHAALNEVVDYGSYASELHRYSNLQLALDRQGRVAARYWWIFPNLMLNFYPWGLSLNVVEPQGIARTRILFRSFVWDESRLDRGRGIRARPRRGRGRGDRGSRGARGALAPVHARPLFAHARARRAPLPPAPR